MNRLLWLILALCLGTIGFGALRSAVTQTRMEVAINTEQSKQATSSLAESQALIQAGRGDVRAKKKRLAQLLAYPNLSTELLDLLERGEGRPAAWEELRQHLGIGWDNSPEYVLVRKPVLKTLSYPRLQSAERPTEEACGLLALSPRDQSAIRSILERTRAECQPRQIHRSEPSGDIVAQYTRLASDPVLDQSASNRFAAEIAAAVGPERAQLLLPQAWREFSTELGPSEAETMTIRRAVVNGEPDLECEMRCGSNRNTYPVRYAHYPSRWFLSVFPGGWQTLAEREGFELPKKFTE